MRAWRVGVALAAGVLLAAGAAAADDKPVAPPTPLTSLTIGILNQQSALKTAERWNPILRYVTEVTGIPVQMRMGATVAETNAMMGRGEFDLVYTNHNFRPEFDGVYRVLARWDEKPIYAVIAVRADSPIKRMGDLRRKRVAFPSKNAFVAYAVPLEALGLDRITIDPVFASHQEGALAQLQAGSVDAAAVNSRFLTQYAAQQKLAYREIYTSEGFPDLAVSVHPRVPPAQASAIQAALLAMRRDPRAAAALAAAGFSGFHPANDRDYDGVRRVYRNVRD